MNLIEYNCFESCQMLPQPATEQHDLRGLGSCDQQVRRVPRLAGSLLLGRITVSQTDAQPQRLEHLCEPPVDVAVQRAQGRDIQYRQSFPALFQRARGERQDGRFGLAAPCGSQQQAVLAIYYLSHRFILYWSQSPAQFLDQLSYLRVKSVERSAGHDFRPRSCEENPPTELRMRRDL